MVVHWDYKCSSYPVRREIEVRIGTYTLKKGLLYPGVPPCMLNVTYILHVSCMYKLHVNYVHVCYMYVTCMLHVQVTCALCTCILYVYYMFITCPISDHTIPVSIFEVRLHWAQLFLKNPKREHLKRLDSGFRLGP